MTNKRKNRARSKGTNKRPKGSRGASSSANSVGPSSTVVRYNGPLFGPGAHDATDTYCGSFISEAAFTTSGGGDYTTIFTPYWTAAPSSAQAGYIALAFREYRILALKVEFVPNNRYQVAAVTTPIYLVKDRSDTTTALTSYSGAVAYPSCVKKTLQEKWSVSIKMQQLEEAGFVPNSTASNCYCIKAYLVGAAATTTFGRIIVTRLVQFRGRY